MADDRQELMELEELDRLESKAASVPVPTMGDVALSAIGRGAANLANTPVTFWNLAKAGAAAMHPQIADYATPTPNYPKMALEKAGMLDPKKEPQTAEQRIVDTAIQTAIGMSVGPIGTIGILKNAAVGAASGAVAQTTKEATGSTLLAILAGAATPMAISGIRSTATSPLQTPTRQQTLEEARAAGYVVQPSTVRPGAVTNKLESIAGKAAVAQDAAVRNQAVTNQLAAKALGLPKDTPLSMDLIETVRDRAAQPYREIAAIHPAAKNTLDELRQVRADATAYFRHYDRSADPASLKVAQQATKKADELELMLEGYAAQAGRTDLMPKLVAGRQLIARTYDVERAWNIGDGNVSAPILGRMLDKGRPLTGELEVIGKFAQAFPRVAREGATVPPPTVSGTDMASMAILSGLGIGAAGGNPMGAGLGALPLLRPLARNAVLTNAYQQRLLRDIPSLSTGLIRSSLVGRSLYETESMRQ